MKILDNKIVKYALGLVALYLTVYIIGAAWKSGKGGESIPSALGDTVGVGGESEYRGSSLG